MLASLFRFELKYHFKQLPFIFALAVFFALGVVSLSGSFGSGEVHKNGPYVITTVISLLSLFCIFAITVCCANVVLRDQNHRSEEIIFTTAITRSQYLSVRFAALLIIGLLFLVAALLGMLLGSQFLDATALGKFNLLYFIHPFFVFGLPNVFFAVTVLFCTAILTKNIRAIYAAGVLIYILYMLASIFGNSPLLATSNFRTEDASVWPFIIDPFGLASFYGETKSWSDVMRNQFLFPLKGAFLINRIVWITFSSILLILSYRFLNFRVNRKRSTNAKKSETLVNRLPAPGPIHLTPRGRVYHWTAFSSQFKIELISLFKHIPFMVMLLLWIFIFGIELKDSLFNGPFGMKFHPTTALIIEQIRNMKLSLILLIFYTAEMVTREQTVNIHMLIYTTPIQNMTLWAAKCGALMMLVFTLVTVNILTGITLQVSHQYYQIELLNYLSLYYYSAIPMFLFVLLLIFIQRLSPNKYLGMMFNLFVVFVCLFVTRLGIHHYLFRFAAVPEMQYSTFNGFGHYAKAFNWYMLYWSALAALLGIFSIAMWRSKPDVGFRKRIRGFVQQWHKMWITSLICVLIACASGTYIFWQTNQIGNYRNPTQEMEFKAAYEKKYRQLADAPQPIIRTVHTSVDLYPEHEKYVVKGEYLIKNESHKAIERIWVSIDQSVTAFKVQVDGAKNVSTDQYFKQQWIELHDALKPGELRKMNFELTVHRTGFMPFDNEHSLSKNGSYIELEKFVPHFGYNADLEVEDETLRKNMRLGPRRENADPDRRYHRIDFETLISVPNEQMVVTVGELKKSWKKNGRSYYHYQTPAPIEFMFALSAAKYTRKIVHHQGVALQLFYLDKHNSNVPAMVNAMKDALHYGQKNFSSYALKQLTMAEIPQYRGAATAYPGLVFAAEKISFLGDFDDPNAVNQSYTIMAHEVGHQWWANQLSPVRIAGAPTLTESLAKYTEAMAVEKKYGKMYLRKHFLADQHLYFMSRDRNLEEQTLAKATDQNYVYYQKGGLVLYAIKEAIGEKKMNDALQRLLKSHGIAQQKATTNDLISELLKEANPQQARFINDGLTKVITYRIKLDVLSAKPIGQGKYAVTLRIHIMGEQINGKPVKIPALQLDVALFKQNQNDWNKDTKPIYLKKQLFQQQISLLTVVVDERPKVAALDPFAYLLDQNREGQIVEIKP